MIFKQRQHPPAIGGIRRAGWIFAVCGTALLSASCSDLLGFEHGHLAPDSGSSSTGGGAGHGGSSDASTGGAGGRSGMAGADSGGTAGGAPADVGTDSGSIDARAMDVRSELPTNDVVIHDATTTDVTTNDAGAIDITLGDASTADDAAVDGGPDGPADAVPDRVTGCSPTTCSTGCCDANDQCVTPPTAGACGSGGARCVSCAAGQSCSGTGTCECTPSSCPAGCCRQTLCVPISNQSTMACGVGGGACQVCPADQECNAQGTCVCGPNSCPSGCCDAAGRCQTSSTATCGTGGAACRSCGAGQACGGSACVCNSSSCPTGCCDGVTCLPYASETNQLCGTGGAACAPCVTGTACNGAGACAPTNWCSQQMIPSGVLVADYQCLDFESGLPSTSTWPQTQTNGGTLAITQARAASLPNSLSTSVPTADDFATSGTATLSFSTVGSAPVSSVSVSASLSTVPVGGVTPAWTGGVDFLCVAFGSASACLQYTRGANTDFAMNYTGLLIEYQFTGGPAYRAQCQVTGTLPTGVWTPVDLRLTSAGAIEIFINGTSAAGTCTVAILGDTVAKIDVGLQAISVTTIGQTIYYDNVVAVVRR